MNAWKAMLTAATAHDAAAAVESRGTSKSHPYRIDWVASRLGVSLAPGKFDAKWNRSLVRDAGRIAMYHVDLVVCLLESWEMGRLGMQGYAREFAERRIPTMRLPIRDGGVPEMKAARRLVATINATRTAGLRVLVHCKGGLGRAGTIAACCLVAEGLDPDTAIKQVRIARGPAAIENKAQEDFVRAFAS